MRIRRGDWQPLSADDTGNLTGNPAISIPAGFIDGLPVRLQLIGLHHEEQLLLDLARLAEREHPWPVVAPTD